MQENFAAEFADAVSETRFMAFQQGADSRTALARYLWNVALCEALYPAFHTLEVGFRNSIHKEFSRVCSCDNWLIERAEILHPRERPSIDSALAKIEQRRRELSEARLIAELSFGFWTSLLDSRYEQIWRQVIAGVFPVMPRRIRTRRNISAMMHPIRKLRNLAFHHHAIWDRDDLERTHQAALDLIGWINPALVASLNRIDRFPAVYGGQVQPYYEHALHLIPDI